MKSGPAATPRDRIPAIKDSCWGVKGVGRGLSSGFTIPFSFGITGDAHDRAIPAVKAIRLSAENSG